MNKKNVFGSIVFLGTFIVSQFPLSGQCASDGIGGPSSHVGLSGSYSKNTAEVATLIAELPEKEPFNVWGFDFSPDGKYLASSSPSSDEIHIWDWRNKRIVRILEKVHGGSSTAMSTEAIRYSPDGRLLAVCHGNATGNIVIRIWSAVTDAVLRDIEEPVGGECKAIGFTPDGRSFGENNLSGPVVSQKLIYDGGNGRIIWQDDIPPIIFDRANSTYYVVASPGTVPECMKHGNPNPPFTFYKYDEGKWVQISHSELPDGLHTNLLVNWYGYVRAGADPR